MISATMLKRDLISGLKLMVPFLLILTMYNSVIIWMYDPELIESLNEFQDIMPEMMAAVGMVGGTGTLLDFIHTYLYGFIMLFVPVIYVIMLVHRYVVKYMDDGSLACILAADCSRKRFVFTQMLAVVIMIFLLIAVMTAIGLGCCAAMFPGDLDKGKYLALNGAVVLFDLLVSGICMAAACFARDGKVYLSIGAGLPLLFYVIQMMANMGGELEKLKYATIYTLMPGQAIVSGDSGVLPCCLAMAAAWILLYAAGGIRFAKRDLSI